MRTRQAILLNLLLCTMGMFTIPIHAGTIIFTDNFPSSTIYNSDPTVGNFTVTSGCVDSIPAGGFGLSVPGVDLDGTCSKLGTITSTLAVHFSPGSTYTLSFKYSSNNNETSFVNKAQVELGSLINTTITGLANTPQAFSGEFSVGSPTSLNLSFQELGTSDDEGVVIGGISISETIAGTPVPEPAVPGFGLVCIGISITGMRRWRKSRMPMKV